MGQLKGYKQSASHTANKAARLRRGRFILCEICQSEFWRKPSEIAKGITRFCSRKCYDQHQTGGTKVFGYRPHLVGANNHNWRGGVTPEHNKIRSSKPYQEWRKTVFERDLFTCQECGAKCGNGKDVVLNADHIKSFADFPELRFDVNNGRTLCVDCHKATDGYGWKYFNARKS